MNSLNDKLNSTAKQAFDLLKGNGLTLSVAESFTGGLIVSSLIKNEGASSVIREGIVCYTHEAKALRLNIPQELIEQEGAVSRTVAERMLDGIIASPLLPDCAIATTGNAGPGAEEKSKRGDAYIAVFVKGNKNTVYKFLDGNREDNATVGAITALETLITMVKKLKEV